MASPGTGGPDCPAEWGACRRDQIDDFLARTRFNEDGLVPAIAQQWDSRRGADDGLDDAGTLRETLATGRGVYYSRSRGERWAKGDTSGHVQAVREARLDCDGDTVLLLVEQVRRRVPHG